VTTYIALLRGLGFPNTLPMKALVRLLERLDLEDVRTYIQSGNVVFRADPVDAVTLGDRITAAIRKAHGFAPQTLVLSHAELKKAMAASPFRAAGGDTAAVHFTFLFAKPGAPDLAAIERLLKRNERYALKGKVFYFLAPDGVGKSKAFARIEKSLGVAGTARNGRSVANIEALAREVAAVR